MIVPPCISICKTDPVTGYCYGCGRSEDEKKIWKDIKTLDSWKKKNLKEMCKLIGVDSLEFLSIDGLYRAMGHEKRNKLYPQYTDHCFTGDYPIEPSSDLKENSENQLSLLTSRSS